MRRKSERNKAKSSPEKKPEKPTRKSTRRRAKKSPSTTPERDNSNEEESPVIDKESSSQKIQTRNQSKELPAETIIEEAESKVTSSDHINEDVVVEDSVWKVSRQDASPGEIQKLRLRRQRNLSETSSEASTTMSRKRLYRLQEGSESGSVAEEADSADERIVKVATPDVTDDTSSTITKLDTTGEEVSHKMENPPSQQTYDMSDDVKRHVDGEGTSYQRAKVDHKPADDVKLQEAKDDGELTTNQPLDGHEKTTDQQQDQDKRQDEEVREDVSDEKIEEKTEKNNEKSKNIEEKSEKIEDESVKAEEKPEISDEKHENLEEKSKKSEETETKTQEIPEVSEKIQEKTVNDEKSVENEESKREKSQEKEEESAKSDDDKSRKDLKSPDSSPSSDDNSRKSVRSTRRKHRDKYRDSSNSDSGDSEDESRRRRRKGKEEEEVKGEEVVVQKSEEEEEEDNGGRKEENVKSVEKSEEKVPEKEEKPVEREKVEVEKAQGGNNVCRPAKVNLKRSYTPRISTDESTKKNDADGVNDATQNKENHATDDTKVVPKRRRWGAALSTDTAPVLSISTDSLKALVPGAKPLSLNEVRLTKDDDEDRERRKERNNQSVEREKTKDEPKANNDASKDNHLGARRKISIVKDTPQLKSPSPPLAQPTSILLIKNLVRPFTLNQIKELLSRTGTIVENGFWMDRIKSKCFVEYSNEDQAFETRQALHGISWPMSNPKKLIVEYSTKEEMEKVKETSKDQAPLRKVEASSGAEVWQQDWSRDEKTNSTTKVTVVREWDLGKEDGQHLLPKDKDKKELDKKKRARSRSPTLEAHLPAPARKFKKKEDEPPPAKLLDDLFRKTKATPCIYWLPLTNEQIVVKEEMRRQHMAEHARRLEEMRRAERNRDSRRRRSPRK